MAMDAQTLQRLQALWKSARGKYDSFYAELESVQREIGAGKLEQWCSDNLRMSYSTIMSRRKMLLGPDEARVKKTFAEADQKDLPRLRADVSRLQEENANLNGLLDEVLEHLRVVEEAAPRADGRLERRCGWCEGTFITQSLAAKYCSVRCRVASHRAAKHGA
jgi:hypothetical protein